MLASLSIRNILLFQNQHIEFTTGLNVLTGETGAGKSLLLDCLNFVLGGRKTPSQFRLGSESSEVAAVFSLSNDHVANAILQEIGIPKSTELVLRRTLPDSGRGAIFINDSRCTAAALRRLGHVLIEIHGQYSSRSQLKPTEHRALLDDFAGARQHQLAVREAWQQLKAAESELKCAEQGRAAAEKEIAFLQHSVQEIDAIDLRPGEKERLSLRRAELKSIIQHQEDLGRAALALGSSGAEGNASDAIRWLENAGLNVGTRLREAADAIDRGLVELNEASRLLDEVRSQFDADPLEIERVDERLNQIHRLERKHSIQSDQLVEFAAKQSASLEQLQHEIVQCAALPSRVAELKRIYDQNANELSMMRQTAAVRLDEFVRKELPPLKLKAATFKTVVETSEAGPLGWDSVMFEASTNEATPKGPIHKIASGGEFSRFMLALKVCLTTRNDGITMVFDEVDREVGGATADAIGRRLRALASETQVLAVTHSPQVAACGTNHLRIEKQSGIDSTRTTVVRLAAKQRVNEIARMLSGEKITDEAEAAALSLLTCGGLAAAPA